MFFLPSVPVEGLADKGICEKVLSMFDALSPSRVLTAPETEGLGVTWSRARYTLTGDGTRLSPSFLIPQSWKTMETSHWLAK